MPMMESTTYYLQNELPSVVNYPEVGNLLPEIELLVEFVTIVTDAYTRYEENRTAVIEVDVHEISSWVKRGRGIAEILGSVSNPCFDLLLDVRGAIYYLQTLLYHQRIKPEIFMNTTTTSNDIEDIGGIEV